MISSLIFVSFDRASNLKSAVPNLSKERSLHFQQSGLLPLYYLTDCLQVISGDKYVVLDPADQYLQTAKQQNKANLMQKFVERASKHIATASRSIRSSKSPKNSSKISSAMNSKPVSKSPSQSPQSEKRPPKLVISDSSSTDELSKEHKDGRVLMNVLNDMENEDDDEVDLNEDEVYKKGQRLTPSNPSKNVDTSKQKDLGVTFKTIDSMLSNEVQNELMAISGSSRIYRYINATMNTGRSSSGSAGLLRQFPDQFAPYIPFALKATTPFPGTIVRIPLRRKEDLLSFQYLLQNGDINEIDVHFPLCPFICDSKMLQRLPLSIKQSLTECLIFGSHIENVSISTVAANGHLRDILYQSRVGVTSTNEKQRMFRAKAFNAASWKKQTISRFFGVQKTKTYHHKLQITTQDSLIGYCRKHQITDSYYESIVAKTGGVGRYSSTNNALQITDNYWIYSNIGDGM